MSVALPEIQNPGRIIGMGRLARALFEGQNVEPIWSALHARIAANPDDVDAIFDASLILRLTGQHETAQNYLRAALDQKACYTVEHGRGHRLTVLVFVAAADVMANAPIDLLFEESDLTVHYLYLDSIGMPELPAHDVAFLAVGEAIDHQPILSTLDQVFRHWPAPIMNGDTARIAMMTRDQVSAALADVAEILCPQNLLFSRDALASALGCGDELAKEGLPKFPFTIRPLGTDCGKGLEKVETCAAFEDYLRRYDDEAFFVSPFIDYQGADQEFRKYRITFIDGVAYPAHLAISPHWIVHYLSAGMSECPSKRAEEARWMDMFNSDFGVRHRAALSAIQTRIGTDYFSIDCGEAPDGRLLFFEADVASIVHALDPMDLFAYKRPHMARLFEAFIQALERRAHAGVGQRAAA